MAGFSMGFDRRKRNNLSNHGGTVSPVSAHHSFAATYFEGQKVTIQGKLVQYLYRI
jgi:hypothetical protein